MSGKLDDFLSIAAWSLDLIISTPRYSRVGETYEAWAYRNGFHHQLRYLERIGHLERQDQTREALAQRIIGITESGRLKALGGRDPEARWGRKWDKRWRLLSYDIPESHRTSRIKFTRILRAECFGFIQKSGWISPDRVPDALHRLSAAGQLLNGLAVVAGRPEPDMPDDQIVEAAWDFDEINSRYQECLNILAQPPQESAGAWPAEDLARREWLRDEQQAWLRAAGVDPMLPKALLPGSYLGIKTWNTRRRVVPPVARALVMTGDQTGVGQP